MDAILLEFLEEVDSINGFYLDCKSGFHAWNEKLISAQAQISKMSGESIDKIDQIDFIYGEGDNPRDRSNWRHRRTQGEVKLRTAKDGADTIMAARLCLVMIYQFWEIYRGKLEKKHNFPKNSIKHDVMGDLRYLRHAILKNKARALSEVAKCKILKWYSVGEEIMLDDQKFKCLIERIEKAVEEIDQNLREDSISGERVRANTSMSK